MLSFKCNVSTSHQRNEDCGVNDCSIAGGLGACGGLLNDGARCRRVQLPLLRLAALLLLGATYCI